MKKLFSKKEILFTVLLSSALLFGFAACNNGSEQNENKPMPEQKPEEKPEEKGTHTAKSSDLIKFNINDVKYLATQWTDTPTVRGANVRAAGTKPIKSLIAVKDDDKGEPVIEVSDVIEVPAQEYKLADWCEPQPVREIYQCPYDTVEDACRGVYSVFAGRVDWWKYQDGTDAPHIGQIMYVKPDGKNVDILNFNNDVDYILATWQKENDGEDYIQFDENGNIFILVIKNGKHVVYRYNPLNDELKDYSVDVNGTLEVNNFHITRDGKWMFLNTMVDKKYNNLYALEVKNGSKPLTLYHSDLSSVSHNDDVEYSVSSVGINPSTNMVYWYVNEYTSATRQNSGLYVLQRSTNGSYYTENIEFYYGLGEWNWTSAADYYIKENNKKDYKGYLEYLKSFCNPERDIENIEFSLASFKNMKDVAIKDPFDEYNTKQDFSTLYKEDANGKVLTEEAALKYLFETKFVDVIPESAEWTWDGAQEAIQQTLWDSIFKDFVHRYYNYNKLGDNFFDGWYAYCHFPFEYVMFEKGTTKSAYTMPSEYVDSSEIAAMCDQGIILANDEGTWVLKDVWDDTIIRADGSKGNNSHSVAFQLTDNKGNFVCKQPGNLANLKFKPRWDGDLQRDEDDPWYKKPFAANTRGIAAISVDQKTIYYHSKGKTIDLLANDTNRGEISAIYSFSLDEDKLIYNATKRSGGHLMVSIDLATKQATKLPIKTQVESMLGVK